MKNFWGWRVSAVGMVLCAAAAWMTACSSDSGTSPQGQSGATTASRNDPRIGKSYRFERGGWIYVHLEGNPAQIGFQHGYWLAQEIADALNAYKIGSTHVTKRDWSFYRETSRNILWPHIENEYQNELQGIVAGVQAQGVQADLDDIVALNAFMEVPGYYIPWYNSHNPTANPPKLSSPGNCSAFVATGSYTRDGKIVIAHNNWTDYWEGERWRIVFDITPESGYHMMMDGFPGVIASDDDFGVNSDGLMVTETTISQFKGFDPAGVPEFVRARKALQYGGSIDDYVRIMLDQNNGGYANDWLLADNKTGEIAQFELGLKDHQLWRTKDGFYVGSNFPSDTKLMKEETDFDPKDSGSSANARHTRWEQIMHEAKGKIDVAAAQSFLADHKDVVDVLQTADERSLCGHTDASARGCPQWEWAPHFPGGAVQGKVMDSKMALMMSFIARAGHPCGQDFLAEPFFAAHPEFAWEKPILHDMKAGPWTEFRAGDKARQ